MSATAAQHDESASILVVDDEPAVAKLLVRMLTRGSDRDLEVEAAGSAADARAQLQRRDYDLVITDLSMPDEDGISLMQWGREQRPSASWIVLTGHGTMQTAVRALQLGAFDFISKPLSSAALLKSVMHALDERRLRAEHDRLHRELEVSNERLRHNVEELAEACRLLEAQAELLESDLRKAALIQRALLPHAPPQTPGLSIQALYRLSHTVGGDLYDVVRLSRRHVVLLIADAAGHGLSAAMLAVLFRSRLAMIDEETHEPARPSQVLEQANRSLMEGFTTPALFLTAAYCLVDTIDGTIQVASAGHPALILQRSSGEFERVFHTGPALGLYSDARFSDQEIRLEPGDRLLLHTDGLYDRLANGSRGASDEVLRCLQEGSFSPETRNGVDWLRRLARVSDSEEQSVTQEDDLTIVSMCAASGVSVFDNGQPLPVPMTAGPIGDDQSEILVGGNAERLTLSLRGRANWTYSSALHQKCTEALNQDKDVTLDLTLCQQLDSTLLGTIHELATRAADAKLEFRLQGVTPRVQRLFEELGMTPILDHMVPITLPLPTHMSELKAVEPEVHERWMRILKAHESLASLNERNRKQFDPLLQMLRKEVESLHSAR